MMKREKERKKREVKEAEEALKKEREMECQSELYLKRLQQRMVETEARSVVTRHHFLPPLSLSLSLTTLSSPSLPPLRLQKQKKELEERKYLERVEMESKLSDIASQRHRTKDIFLIPPPAVGAGAGGDVDDKSKSSNGSTKKDKVSALPKIKRLKGSESTSDTLQV
jgi:hypothetical protein